MADLDFWFSIGSTYSYLTVSRLDDELAKHGLSARWRPFNVRRIMRAQNNNPFGDKPAKSAYMWRDIARRANRFDIPVQVPAPYPIDDLPLANQIAVLGMSEGWGKAYVQEAYRLWFQQGLSAGEEPNFSRALTAAGQDPEPTLARARSDTAVGMLEAETDAAEAAGVFGAPTLSVNGELFWGDDRIPDAIAWCQGHTIA